MILAETYLARHGGAFAAYMALQRALLVRWVERGHTEEEWCARMAPVFHAKYRGLIGEV